MAVPNTQLNKDENELNAPEKNEQIVEYCPCEPFFQSNKKSN